MRPSNKKQSSFKVLKDQVKEHHSDSGSDEERDQMPSGSGSEESKASSAPPMP